MRTTSIVFSSIIGFFFLFLVLLFYNINFNNCRVDGGYAAYVYSNPLWFGQKKFVGILQGPNSTGLVWRQRSINVCVTPYTMTETFTDIRAKDQLKMTAEAYLVYRIDKSKVKEFVEEYGAIADVDRTPESIANDAYESFIKQPFRTAVRSAIAKFNGLDAPEKIQEITTLVYNDLSKKLEGSPFIIESITIGSTTPPESVTDGITKKVEATQEYERQAIQLEIAKQEEQVAEAQGRAAANKMQQEAQGALAKRKAEIDGDYYQKVKDADSFLYAKEKEAEGIKKMAEAQREMNAAIGDNLIRMETVRNLDKIKFPNIVVGTEAISPLTTALENLKKKE